MLLMQDEFYEACGWVGWRKNILEEIQFQSAKASQRSNWSSICKGAWRVSKAGRKFLCKSPSWMYLWHSTRKIASEQTYFLILMLWCDPNGLQKSVLPLYLTYYLDSNHLHPPNWGTTQLVSWKVPLLVQSIIHVQDGANAMRS